MRASFLLLGTAFGFVLSRAGATTFDLYADLFLFADLQLMWVIGVAAAVGAVGLRLLNAGKINVASTGQPVAPTPKPMHSGIVPGSLLFGAGWGLVGACPGTALAMLGEGKLAAGVTIAGIGLGTGLYGWQQDRRTVVVDNVVPAS